MSTLLHAFDQRFRFAPPSTFADFAAQQFFDTASDHYVLLHDMEWLSSDEVAAFTFQSYQLPRFIPFARSGGGDLWCWEPKARDFGEPRVLACWRDSYDATVYAPTFIAAVYRQLIDVAVSAATEPEEVESNREQLVALSAKLSGSLPPDWLGTIQRIAELPVQSLRSTGRRPTDWFFLLTADEGKKIIGKDIHYAPLDSDIRWQIPIEEGA